MSGHTRASSRQSGLFRIGASGVVLGAAVLAAGCSSNVSRFDYPMFANNAGDAGMTTSSIHPVPPQSIYPNGRDGNSTNVVRRDLPPPQQPYGSPQAYAAAPPPQRTPVAPQTYQTPPPYQPPAPPPVAQSKPPAPPKPVYKTVTVRSGDTLSKYSREHGVSVEQIKVANDMSDTRLSVGQKVVIPVPGAPTVAKGPVSEYAVVRGDSISKIAREQDVSQDELIALNKLKRPYRLSLGQKLKIPGKAVAAKPDPVRVASTSAAVPLPAAKPASSRAAPPPASKVAARTKSLPKPEPMAGNQFRWPVKGRIVSGYGAKANGKHNDGINVAVPKGTSIKAAENGVVAYAGSELEPYGNLVLIRHANNWVTAYAHNDELLVKRGDTVRRGQVIAKAGQTGSVTQPQLHFELRKGSKPVNPLSYMANAS